MQNKKRVKLGQKGIVSLSRKGLKDVGELRKQKLSSVPGWLQSVRGHLVTGGQGEAKARGQSLRTKDGENVTLHEE